MWFLLACQAKPTLDVQMSLKDLTPPQVVSITPANGTTEVTDKPTIVIAFNEPMDAATLNSATVTVKTANGTAGVGSYEYDSTTNALAIKIVQSLYLNTQYTITITDKVKDKAGNAIAPVNSNFSTDVCPKARRGQPIFNNYVRAMVRVGCSVFVGGDFTRVGEVTKYGLPLDVNTGQKVDSFTYETIDGGAVYTILPDGQGGWLMGGDFTRVGNYPRSRLARVAANGEVMAWNPGANGTVKTMLVAGSVLYLGGNFTTVGGITRNYLAAIRLDAACLASFTADCLLAWHPNANDGIHALAASGTTLYVGGTFTQIAGDVRKSLAALKTDAACLANFVPGCLTSFYHEPNVDGITALEISGTTVFIGGAFSCLGNCVSGAEGVTKWTRGRLAALDISGSVLSWNPTANSPVQKIAIVGDTLLAGGNFTTIGSTTRNRLAAISIEETSSHCLTSYSTGCLLDWNPDANQPVATFAVSANTLYAGGSFTTVSTLNRSYLAAISIDSACLTSYSASCVQAWAPAANGAVAALAIDGSAIYAGGSFTSMSEVSRNYLAALDTNGRILSLSPNANSNVFALASSGNMVIAGGNFTNINGSSRWRIAALASDGTLLNWNPFLDNIVRALAISGTTLYAGGNFTTVNSVTRNRLVAFSIDNSCLTTYVAGTCRLPWDPNANNQVNGLLVSGSTVYAGGSFTSIGLTPRNRLAAISTGGTLLDWNPDANNSVSAFAISGTTLYVGGDFTTIGSTTRNRLAALSVDSGCLSAYSPGCRLAFDPSATDGILTTGVYALALSGSALYAGGNFTKMGGVTRNHLAAFGSDGSLLEWNPDAGGVTTPSIFTLTAAGKTLFAAGHFTTIGGNFHGRMVSLNTDGGVNW